MKKLQQNYITKDIISKQMEKFNFQPYTFYHYNQSNPGKLKNDSLAHYKMFVLLRGSFDIRCNKEDYHISVPGTMIIIQPLLLFDISISESLGAEFYYIDFDITANTEDIEMTAVLKPNPVGILTDLNNNLILALFAELDKSNNQKSVGNYYLFKSLLEYMVTMAWGTYIDRSPSFHPIDLGKTPQEKIVLECIIFLNRNMDRYVSVNELCKIVHVSQSYLYQCFMSVLNCSTKDFITNYKLRRIAYDLVQNLLSIEELAKKYGYTSIYSFSTTFKKHFGISPLKYRKECHSKERTQDYDNKLE